MTGRDRASPTERCSALVYRLLLFAYPSAFRREYGREMEQAFRTQCRQVRSRERLALWGAALADLAGSAVRERAAGAGAERVPAALCALGIGLILAAARIHTHGDADAAATLLLMAGPFLCGTAGRQWWSGLTGCAGALLLLGHPLGPLSPPLHDSDIPLPAVFLAMLASAWAGSIIRGTLTRDRIGTST